MPEEHNNELPSIEDIVGQQEILPSVEEFLAEEKEEDIQTIEDAEGNTFIEVQDLVKPEPWIELVRMINDVRESIPEIPEIKTYDKELEAICEIIDEVKSNIPVVPEVRYYEEELELLKESIENVKNSIPELPQWIQNVNEVPDFSWIGKTFNVIDENFRIVRDSVETVSEQVQVELNKLIEQNDVENFEIKTDFKTVHERVSSVKKEIFDQLKEQSNIIWNLQKKLKDNQKEFEIITEDNVGSFKETTLEIVSKLEEKLLESTEIFGNRIDAEVESLQSKISSLPKPKYYEQELKDIREKLSEIGDLKVLIEEIKEKQQNLQEGYLLSEPPDNNNSDPLTPLDQKFATLDDLSNHYRIFINRIQTQLAAIGGGGAGFIRDLDDVDITGLSDGYVLRWNNSANKWRTVPATGIGVTLIDQLSNVAINTSSLQNLDVLNYDSSTGLWRNNTQAVGAAGTWSVTSVGINTTKNVGIATTSAKSGVALYVVGDAEITGNISVAGTITYDDVTNVDSLGIITARQDVEVQRNLYVSGITTLGATNGIGTVTVGVGSTALLVDGDARIIGILTIGRASITLDGNTPSIKIGETRLSAAGINSAPNVIYVAKDGNDSNNGNSIDNAFLTIGAAVGVATTGTTIRVKAGNYLENNPIEVPAFVSIVGDDLKTVTVSPNIANDDLFHVRKGCYIANMTFTNHIAPAAAVAFPTTGIANNQDGGIWESPYIQNCTSNTTTGTGLRIDGNQAELLKSMVCDSYTQYNQGGVGVAVTNGGFAQLVSVFTICCNEANTCDSGGQVDLTNSNSSFGTYGLVARGVGERQFTEASVGITTAAAQDRVTISGLGTERPYDGQVVYFGNLYQSINTINLTNVGSGYTVTPNIIIDAPTGPSGTAATAFATLNGDKIDSITIISSGTQYETTPTITIDAPLSGTQATASATMSPIYYTINSSTTPITGISTITLEENLINSVSAGTTAYFYQVSRIVASSHTFEYVGSGNTIQQATPRRGGVTVQANEVVTENGGKVVYTSTDQAGNFRIGDGLQINQNNGTISGRAFSRSLFSEITPFILALS
jgi:hypothetical protein